MYFLCNCIDFLIFDRECIRVSFELTSPLSRMVIRPTECWWSWWQGKSTKRMMSAEGWCSWGHGVLVRMWWPCILHRRSQVATSGTPNLQTHQEKAVQSVSHVSVLPRTCRLGPFRSSAGRSTSLATWYFPKARQGQTLDRQEPMNHRTHRSVSLHVSTTAAVACKTIWGLLKVTVQ